MKTSKIDYTNTITIPLDFGPDFGADTRGEFIVPAYGEYGAPQNFSNENEVPIDALDTLFQEHDLAILAAGVLEPAELVEPHANLINGILALDEAKNGLLVVDTTSPKPEGDAEATAYAAFTLYAITADIVQNDRLVDDDLLGDFEAALDYDVPAVIAQAESYADKSQSSAKPLRDTFDLFENAFDELLEMRGASQSAADWDAIG
jgi:hypothetical protein